MVRTKADGAVRVAAGGKAPKKTAARAMVSSPSSNDKGGRDHLPGNRACPRETPNWQKKITFFYDRNKSTENSEDSSSSNSKKQFKPEKNDTVVDDGDNVEMEEENSNVLETSTVDESESMETDE